MMAWPIFKANSTGNDLKGLKSLPKRGNETLHVFALAMGFNPRKARPAEAQAWIVAQGQLVRLVREQRAGTEEREFSGIGCPTGTVGLVIAGSSRG